MEHLDLNINNYKFTDLLNLFQIPYSYNKNDLEKVKEQTSKMHPSKSKLKDDFFMFFSKAYKLLESVYSYREKKIMRNVKYYPSMEEDESVMSRIIKIPRFEGFENIDELIDKVIENPIEKAHKKMELERKRNMEQKDLTDSLGYNKPLITDQADNKFFNVFENAVIPGDINSIKRIIQLKNVHLNSCFRDKYYTSNPCNFQYTLPFEVKNVVSMRLASIEIPNSWYLFDHKKKNNQFRIEVTNCGKCKVFYIVIPDGNYDNETLVHFLNHKYFFESGKEDGLQYIKFYIDPINFKTRFEIICPDVPKDYCFSLKFVDEARENNIMNTAGWIFGFRLANYLDIKDAVQSEGLFDAGGDRYVYFCVEDFKNNKNEANVICFDESSLNQSVLGKIPMVNGKLSLVINETDGSSLTKTRRYNGPVNIKKIHVRLLDRFGDVIDLNNMDYSFTLELEILYDRNQIRVAN